MVRRSPSAQIAVLDLPYVEGLLTLPPLPSNNASRLVPHPSNGCGWASAVSEDSLHHLLNCTCKTAQDARQFVFGAFFRSVPTARLKLPIKTAQDARHFFAFFTVPKGPRWSVYCWRLVGLKGHSSSSHMWRQRASCCLTRTCVLSKGTRCNNSGCCR